MKTRATKAPTNDLLKAAYHELGHAFVAHELGVHVASIYISRDGGGMCDMGMCNSVYDDLRITVAGYVAECLATGREPTSADMREDVTMDEDVKVINNIGGSGRVKIWVALPDAIKYCKYVLTKPENIRRLDALAPILLRRKYLNGKGLFP